MEHASIPSRRRLGSNASSAPSGFTPVVDRDATAGKPLTGFDLLCLLAAALIASPFIAALVSAAGQL